MSRYEDDTLWVKFENDFKLAKFDAVEVARDKNTVTLEWTIGDERTRIDATLMRGRIDRHVVVYRPTIRFAAVEDHVAFGEFAGGQRRIWETNFIDWQEERELVDRLSRKYKHVVLARDDDSVLEEAKRIHERDYWNDVRDAADALKRMIEEGEVTDRDDFYDRLHEYVDGHERVIYTSQAQECLLFSRHDGDAVEEGLVDASCFKDGVPWSAMAFEAFKQDVLDQLGSMEGIDLNEDDLGVTKKRAGFVYSETHICDDCIDDDQRDENPRAIAAGEEYECDFCGETFIAKAVD